jgi:hypothetical protein
MSVLIDFVTYLLTKSAITDLVGTRIFVDKLPESITTRPSVTAQRISTVHQRHLGGESGIATDRIQVDVWGATSATTDAVAEAIRIAIDGQGPLTMGTTAVVRPFDDGESSSYSTSVDASDQGEHRVTQEWIVWYAESTP